jgi:RNA polymerase sigma-70 factor, ECF subfamily
MFGESQPFRRKFVLGGSLRAASGPWQRKFGGVTRPMKDIDAVVIRRAQRGDVSAFAEIVRFYQSPVLSTIYRLVGGHFPEDVEDLGQDLFMKIYRSLDRFDKDRGVKFSTWLFTSVKNLCYDHLRKKRLPLESIDGGRDEDRSPRRQLPDDAPEPGTSVLRRELGDAIGHSVSRLPVEQRTAFVLREYQSFSYDEIARMTDSSVGTVKSRVFRAKENLRYMLTDYLKAR